MATVDVSQHVCFDLSSFPVTGPFPILCFEKVEAGYLYAMLFVEGFQNPQQEGIVITRRVVRAIDDLGKETLPCKIPDDVVHDTGNCGCVLAAAFKYVNVGLTDDVLPFEALPNCNVPTEAPLPKPVCLRFSVPSWKILVLHRPVLCDECTLGV